MTDDPTFDLELPRADNPDPRVPVALVLDTSGSMSGEAIRQLNAGLDQFRKEVADDELARKRAEITVVTFGPAVVAQKGNMKRGVLVNEALDSRTAGGGIRRFSSMG